MRFPRTSGVLLHPTSLPGPFGIGDLGASAHLFIDWLAEAGQGIWQVLPLGPTSYGDSPYQSLSAFAGNPLLVSPFSLVAEGLLATEHLGDVPDFPAERVDFCNVIEWKDKALRRSFAYFKEQGPRHHRMAFERFRSREGRRWLHDYGLFRALKDAHDGAVWNIWPAPLARREPRALARAARDLSAEILYHEYVQYLFHDQWKQLRQHAGQKGVLLFGDMPIFCAFDSADAWGHRELFYVDEECRPTVVAGVPPDYFSETGQLWGNPLYRWDVMHRQRYRWWYERMRNTLALVDLVRIDHFRGLAAYWEVPAEEQTAVNGRWVEARGSDLFQTLQRRLPRLPIIAEDLGTITPDVDALREAFGFPGMKVLQFAFDGKLTNPYLPHNITEDYVVYTGTHDNDTTLGWYEALDKKEQEIVDAFLDSPEDVAWKLTRVAHATQAVIAVVPFQDLLGLGKEARMNTPGVASGNWTWRCRQEDMSPGLAARLRKLAESTLRFPVRPEQLKHPQEETPRAVKRLLQRELKAARISS